MFELFIRYMYYGDDAFEMVGNGGINLTVKDVLYLCECAEFYGLADSEHFKAFTEKKMSESLDKQNILYDLQLAH